MTSLRRAPSELFNPLAAPEASSFDATLWWAAIAMVAVVTLVALCVAVIRKARPRIAEDERAFRKLAGRLRLRRADRAVVRSRAQRIAAPPVALLLSPALFVQASQGQDADATLRRRLEID